MAANPKSVEYIITLNAQQAILQLEQLTAKGTSFDQKIKMVSQFAKKFGADFGMSGRAAMSVLKDFDKMLDTTGEGSRLFGALGKQAWGDVSREIQNTEPHLHRFERGINAVRIAAGALIAVGLFQFLNFLSGMFRKAIESVQQLEMSIYKLRIAEKSLSESGIEISMKDFRDMVKEIKKLYPFISDIDAQKIVGSIGILTKDLKLTKEQLEDLSKIVPALAIQGVKLGLTYDQALQQVINGLTTSGRGWKDLGITVDAQIIKERAIHDHIVENEEAWNALTAEQQQQAEVAALINIAMENANDIMSSQDQLLGTVSDSTRTLSGAWEDFTTLLGEVFKPILVGVTQALIIYLQIWKGGLTIIGIAMNEFVAAVVGGIAVIDAAFHGNIKSLDDVKNAYIKASEDIKKIVYPALFPSGVPEIEIGTKLTGIFKADLSKMLGLDKYVQDIDTATSKESDLGQNIDMDKAKKEIEDLEKDLKRFGEREKDILDKFEQDWSGADISLDFALNVDKASDQFKQLGRDVQDFVIDAQRKEQDYQIKRQRFLEDSNDKIADKNREYHQRELDDEAKFQEQLRQLRARYLFDLEDALRDRDARQVRRLQAKYEMDKEAAINEHNLKNKEDAKQHAEEVQQALDDRAEKLRQMDEDHQLEMARRAEDYQIKAQQAKEDRDRELADLEAQRQARIQEAAKTIADEYGLKADSVKAIYDLLNSYYGQGGVFDKLYDYSNQSMVAKAQEMVSKLQQILAQAQAAIQQTAQAAQSMNLGGGTGEGHGSPYVAPKMGNLGHQAQGGTYLATKPTTAVFGEAGAELATFIPLGRPGASGGRLRASLGQEGGKISIEMLLSPDLEARVVSNTLNATAEVIVRNLGSK